MPCQFSEQLEPRSLHHEDSEFEKIKPSIEEMLDVGIPEYELKQSLPDSSAPDLRLRLRSEARTAGGKSLLGFHYGKEQGP